MKTAAFVLVSMVVGSLATPTIPALFRKVQVHEVSNERIVTGPIVEAIENFAQRIRDAGLDPFKTDLAVGYELPVPVLLSANAAMDKLLFTGLSDIIVENIHYSLLQSRLTFTLAIPQLSASIDNLSAGAVVLGHEFDGALSGSVNVNRIRVVGDVRVNVSIIGSITIRSLSLQFSLGGIESNLSLSLFGVDLSEQVNYVLATKVPAAIRDVTSEINELLEIIVYDIISGFLD